MTRPEAEAIYDAGKEAVVRVLLAMDARIDALEHQVQSLSKRLDASEQAGAEVAGATRQELQQQQ